MQTGAVYDEVSLEIALSCLHLDFAFRLSKSCDFGRELNLSATAAKQFTEFFANADEVDDPRFRNVNRLDACLLYTSPSPRDEL